MKMGRVALVKLIKRHRERFLRDMSFREAVTYYGMDSSKATALWRICERDGRLTSTSEIRMIANKMGLVPDPDKFYRPMLDLRFKHLGKSKIEEILQEYVDNN